MKESGYVELVFADGPAFKQKPWNWLAGLGAFVMEAGGTMDQWCDELTREERNEWRKYADWWQSTYDKHDVAAGAPPIGPLMAKRFGERLESFFRDCRDADHPEPAP